MKLHRTVAVFLALFFVSFASFSSRALAVDMPPIAAAAAAGNAELIKEHMDGGADVTVELVDGHTPLSLAINANCRACIVQLVSIESVLNKTASEALPKASIAQKLAGASNDTIRFAVDMRVFSSLNADQRAELERDLNRQGRDSMIRIGSGDYNKFFWQKNSRLDVLSAQDLAWLNKQNAKLRSETSRQQTANKKRAERDQRETERKQKQAERVVDALIDQNPELNDVLRQIADGKDLCRYSSQISTGIKKFSCEYMTEGQTREYGRSESCQSAKQALSQTASNNTLMICDATKKAEAQVLDSLENEYQKTAMRQRLGQSGSGKWNQASVEQHFAYPVAELEQTREAAKGAQEQRLRENTQRAWANFSNALEASSSAYHDSPAAKSFRQFQRRANQAIIDHKMLQAAQRQASRGSETKHSTHSRDQKPTAKKSSKHERLVASAELCEQNGGRFDAAANNCTIGASSSDDADSDWVWKTRLDCGSTHFDDVMPEKAVVCMNAAIPSWQIVWRNKPLLGGIHIAVFSIENQSDVSLKFEMVGRARGDMETKNFEWKVTVPARSTRTYHGGIVQMEEPIHNIELRNLRIREPVL